ncbi:SDR family oxidoreductase [Streptomyces cavernicola]|uniref:SDR family oxidoreductase n=1 Tax=Streptomyces cavernicola TaxID=3043613 RepID=A0ABT6S5R6_9ACTN|nr:SDR family oxidoreductase [Streptomyces sp. B-S-A6]MDI3403365.1 SDR family oxidoreductase [Streptomyces sp. B-S-A6]
MTRSPAGAVVTGAGRGLGRQLARLLLARGYQVLVTDVNPASAQEAADELGDGATALAVDVRDQAQVEAARDAIVSRAGRLDVWVNNAGVLVTGPAWEQDEAGRRLMLDVNALGTINGTVAAISAMRRTGGGHVVNIVSLAGLTAVAGEAVYAASKHAAIGFSLSTMADLRLAGVRDVDISCVCPDGIWTPMLHDKLDDPGSALSFSGKLLKAEEVVEAVRTVLDKPRLVTALPGRRGLAARLASLAPRLGLAAAPLVVARGRRTQKRLLADLRQRGAPKA